MGFVSETPFDSRSDVNKHIVCKHKVVESSVHATLPTRSKCDCFLSGAEKTEQQNGTFYRHHHHQHPSLPPASPVLLPQPHQHHQLWIASSIGNTQISIIHCFCVSCTCLLSLWLRGMNTFWLNQIMWLTKNGSSTAQLALQCTPYLLWRSTHSIVSTVAQQKRNVYDTRWHSSWRESPGL